MPLAEAGQFELVDGEQRDRRGHPRRFRRRATRRTIRVLLIESGGERAFFIADLAPTTAHLPLPWIMGYDVEPLVTLETKRRILTQAAAERLAAHLRARCEDRVEPDRSRRKGIRIAEVSHEGSAPPASWIDALLTPDGQALLQELADDPPTRDDGNHSHHAAPRTLCSGARHGGGEQTALRSKAESKFSNAQRMYFTRAGLEQASSERMARHHARRYAAFDRIADLCTGIGGDLIGLAAERAVLAVDSDPVHVAAVATQRRREWRRCEL